MQGISTYDTYAEKYVRAVYSALVEVISHYAESDCFNRAPAGGNPRLYYRRRVDEIESIVLQLYGHDALVKKMLSVTRGIKKMICSYDFPGVPQSWYAVNPNLRFYTAGFAILAEAPDFYEKIKNREIGIRLDYYPEQSEAERCFQYFSDRFRENDVYHYNINDFFQRELICTVRTIFDQMKPASAGKGSEIG